MKFADQRKKLLAELQQAGINDKVVLAAMGEVPREDFIPADMQILAYRNHPIEIGAGQTISQPYIIARMLQELQIEPDHSVLEIGTGSGYQTAIISLIAATVYTVERIESLALKARQVLKKLEYKNIHYRVGDGTRGWEKAFPARKEFDRIIISAAAPHVPEILLQQLAEGGILVAPVGERQKQTLIVVHKNGGVITTAHHGGCTFVPLIGEDGWEA